MGVIKDEEIICEFDRRAAILDAYDTSGNSQEFLHRNAMKLVNYVHAKCPQIKFTFDDALEVLANVGCCLGKRC